MPQGLSIQDLEQQTEEWRKWRQTRIGASESAAVLGVSPWSTRFELWQLKTGRYKGENKSNPAMDLGNRFEPALRAQLELETGLDFPAEICEHPVHKFVVASLDGRARIARTIAEFKLPGKDVFNAAKLGEFSKEDKEIVETKGWKIAEYCEGGLCVPKYYVQVQQQLMVTGDEKVLYYCGKLEGKGSKANITDTALVKVYPDLAFQKMLLFELVSFYDFIVKDIPPPLTDDDVFQADDQSTVFIFAKLKKLKHELKKADYQTYPKVEAELKKVKEEAIDHIEHEIKHPKVSAVGVSMSKSKKGFWTLRLNEDCIEAQS